MYTRSIENSKASINRSILLNKVYALISTFHLNQRQEKVLKKLVEKFPEGFEGGLTNKKYVAITKTSPETAKRDIKKLVDYNLLKKNEAGGRSTSYSIGSEISKLAK